MANKNEWSDAKALALKDFLKANPDFIASLEKATPKCEGDTIDASALSGRQRQGFQDAIAKIKLMATPNGRAPEESDFIK